MHTELCSHCGSKVKERVLSKFENSVFCCIGCRSAFSVLRQLGLSDTYYRLRGSSTQAIPAQLANDQFRYLDDPSFKKVYCRDSNETSIQFYLEGVHCAACIWVVEKIPEIIPDVVNSRLELGSGLASIEISQNGSFSDVAQFLNSLGYRPHVVKAGEEKKYQIAENRRELVRMGIAGFSSANLMLYAVSLYAGAVNSGYQALLEWWSFVVFLPAFFYGGLPFYRSAYSAIVSQKMSIDVPLVLGMILGAIMSTINLFQSNGVIYFDSIATLIFLLLASRYVLKRSQQRALESSSLSQFLTPSIVRKWKIDSNSSEEVSLDRIEIGEIVEVRSGETIPVDGKIIRGRSFLNESLITGESQLVSADIGQIVYAGTINDSSPLWIEATSLGAASRVGRIISQIEQGKFKKAPVIELADKVAKYFLWGVVFISGGLLIASYWIGLTESLNRILSVIIITCPCGLALATPLAMVRTIARAGKKGIIIKSSEALQRIYECDEIFLDKTGTLTSGSFNVINFNLKTVTVESKEYFNILCSIFALEGLSSHPIAKALVRYSKEKLDSQNFLESAQQLVVTDFQEIAGYGVRGYCNGQMIEISRARSADSERLRNILVGNDQVSTQGTWVEFKIDGKILADIELGDKVLEDAKISVQELQSKKVFSNRLWVLTGDTFESGSKLAQILGISVSNVKAECSPEQKAEVVKQSKYSLMVGDGANDSLALSVAHASIAAHGGMEVSLRVADCYLSVPGLKGVLVAVELAKESFKVLNRNFLFSVLYNILGAGLGIFGLLNPLWAAVIMPLSALTVFFSSMVGTRRMGLILKGVAKK